MEIWKPIPDYPCLEASSLGRIKMLSRRLRYRHAQRGWMYRVTKPRMLPQMKQNAGYLLVWFMIDGKRKAATVHSLVLSAFVGPRPKGFDCCHNNGNRIDNRIENLRYDTRRNNHLDKFKHGTFVYSSMKLSHRQIIAIMKLKGTASGEKIAKQYGVAAETIRRIWIGLSWKHITRVGDTI